MSGYPSTESLPFVVFLENKDYMFSMYYSFFHLANIGHSNGFFSKSGRSIVDFYVLYLVEVSREVFGETFFDDEFRSLLDLEASLFTESPILESHCRSTVRAPLARRRTLDEIHHFQQEEIEQLDPIQ